jgi:hypothetical protein
MFLAGLSNRSTGRRVQLGVGVDGFLGGRCGHFTRRLRVGHVGGGEPEIAVLNQHQTERYQEQSQSNHHPPPLAVIGLRGRRGRCNQGRLDVLPFLNLVSFEFF